jgi:ketosteroid isomerase-like protein
MEPDAIAPARATSPAEAFELLCEALSDGDVEAAASLYEPGAVLSTGPGERWCAGELREALACIANMKRPVEASVLDTVVSGEIALVLVSRSVCGLAGESRKAPAGLGAATLRKQPHETWMIVTDHWGLSIPWTGALSS